MELIPVLEFYFYFYFAFLEFRSFVYGTWMSTLLDRGLGGVYTVWILDLHLDVCMPGVCADF